MKTLILAATTSLLAFNAHAQNSPNAAPQSAAPQSAAPAVSANSAPESVPTATAPNGYDLLIEAGKLILPGENGSPSASETLAPDENLRRQRLAVTRNAPALALMRQALRLPISTPLVANYDAPDLIPYGKFRELARQLIQESDVRAADGDAVGALNSRLDCLEMGAAVSRGPVISMLVGVAIESIARNGLEPLAAKLDAPQLRLAAERMRQIEARRPTFSDIVRLEGEQTLQLSLYSLFPPSDAAARAELATPEGRKKLGVSEREARDALALTPERVRADNARLFTTLIGAARISPRLAAMVPMPVNLNPVTELSGDILAAPGARFSYERSVAQNRLLLGALELRAQKLETGAYPAQFAAPRDPFSPDNALVYRIDGDKYTLYSVGPDARDNGGRAIRPELLTFDGETGQASARKTRSFNVDSRGDVLAPVF